METQHYRSEGVFHTSTVLKNKWRDCAEIAPLTPAAIPGHKRQKTNHGIEKDFPNVEKQFLGCRHRSGYMTCRRRISLCYNGNSESWFSRTLLNTSCARSSPLCKHRNSVKGKFVRNWSSASNGLLYLIFMYLVFSSFLLFNQGLAAAGCTTCPDVCDCTTSVTNCHIDCSGKLESIPGLLGFDHLADTLDLSSNGLDSIEDKFFIDFTQLKNLFLHDNQLSSLPKSAFQALPSLINVTLHNNNWTCTCDLDWMQDLVKGTSDLTGIAVLSPEDVLCSNPSTLLNQPLKDVNLSTVKCASSYISCLANEGENGTVILWEYTDLETSITEEVACKQRCYNLGYTYAMVHSIESMCLCSSGEIPESVGSSCNSVCDESPPSSVCGREVVRDSVLSTCIVPKFDGIRTYSQREAVHLSVIPDFTVESNFIWNFNDSTAVIVTQKLDVTHKYALAGTYYITVTVSGGKLFKAYSFPITVEEPISGVQLSCNATVEINENINARVHIRQGTHPRLSWTSTHYGTIEHDQTGLPSQTKFLEAKRTGYSATIFERKGLASAEATCKNNHGNLAIIDAPEVTEFLMDSVVNTISPPPESLFWVGTFIDSNIGFTVFHINGHSISETMHTNWGENEPNLEDPSRRCVAFNVSDGGKWYLMPCGEELPYICQYQSTDFAEEPRHFISGTTVFGSSATSALTNITEATASPVAAGEKVYTLLFPGLWLHHDGIIGSWEFSGPNTPHNGTVRLQLFRPNCATGSQTIRPGCASKKNPYSVCGSAEEFNDCVEKIIDCPSRQQFCPITKSCKSLSLPCSQFDSDGSSPVPVIDPNYQLMSEHIINVPMDKNEIYQMILEDGEDMKMDDVIGISFTLASTDINNVQINHLPILCQSSNLSSWRQNALLVQSSDWTAFKNILDVTNKRWIESIWCDVRIHYSQETTAYQPTTSFLMPTDVGNYTYSVLAFNNASQSDTSSSASSCQVEVRDSILSVSVLWPEPIGKSPENDTIIRIAKGSTQAIALEIEGGGPDVEGDWQGLPSGFTKTHLQNNCPSEITLDTCVLKSGTSALRITTTDMTVSEDDDNLTVEVTVRNGYSSKKITIRVSTEEQITGLRILPAAITRVLASIPQIFTAEVDAGADISYSWIVDDLVQFKYKGQQYNVLFRTPAEYVLTVVAENSLESQNQSVTLTVDEMNPLSSLEFIGVPDPFIAQTDTVVEFKATFLVDINIDYEIDWTINNDLKAGLPGNQPHFGDPDPDPDIKRVHQTTAENASFPTTGEKEIEIRVYNDYDSITVSTKVDIRAPLTAVAIEMTSEVPAVGDDLEFQVTGSPSTYGAKFWYTWGDGTSDDGSDLARITHAYAKPGTYTINVTADNEINDMSNSTTVTVYERITGLTVNSDGPTELTLSTIITATIDTGIASAIFSYDFGDSSVTPVPNVTTLTQTVKYNATGKYNVSVTAVNLISSQRVYYKVHVFQMEIVDVNTTEDCFKTDSNATIRAFVSTDAATLFEYEWTFEDGTTINVNSDNGLDHIFTSAGQHNVTVKVTSKNTGAHDEMSLIVCVQDEITSAIISDAPPTELGLSTTFILDSAGGTNPQYTIDFGDGTTPHTASVTLSEFTHTYNETGNYTVVFTAKNLVSEVSDTAYLPVQEAVKGVNITTSSAYAPLMATDLEVIYTATTTAGSDLQYEWDFGDGTPLQNGSDTPHIYSTTGNFIITVHISNLISNESFNLPITVKEPVSGTTIDGPGTLVKANTTVNFAAAVVTGGSGAKYYWKVTPGHDYTLGIATFTYMFPDILNYSVSVKVENEVSADYAEIFVISADPIVGVNISSDDLVSGRYVASGEETRFEAVLISGESVSATTAGRGNLVVSDWTVSKDGVVEQKYNDSDVIHHSFQETGLYIVHVNISNGVSSQENEIEVEALERIGNITFINIDGFEGAAPSGEEVKIMAIVTKGTDLEFYWDPDHGTSYPEVDNQNLTYVYDIVDTYYPFVQIKNILGEITESYTLVVQDAVSGLVISHLDAVVPFYVPLMERTNFRASVTTGTDASYSWYYVDTDGYLSRIENTTNPQMNWKFPEVTAYTLIVNASNLISWDQVNYTVIVVQQIANLDIVVDSLIVATNEIVQLNGTVSYGDDVIFQFFIDGNEVSGNQVNEHLSYLDHVFDTSGTYEVLVVASNNVSSTNTTKTISVRDSIASVQIGGCCVDGDYVATGDNLTFSAILASGTDVTYAWEIIYETGEVVQANGATIHQVLTVPGYTEVKLSAENAVSDEITRIFLFLQDGCIITLSVDDPGRTQYTNENITLRMLVVQGTNVTHSILWGDLTKNPEKTAEDFANHIYRLKGDYTVTVNSSNEVSWVENDIGISIEKIQCVAPSISFVQNTETSNFFRSRTIYVESTLTTNCSAYEVSYTWLVYKQEDCTTLDESNVQRIAANTNKPLLVLPALTLEVSNYCFQVEVSYEDTYLSDRSAISVGVLSTPLTVVIIGGTTRFLSQDVSLVLDAGRSFDPDVPADNSKGLSYFWTCNSSTAFSDSSYGYLPATPSTKFGLGSCAIPLEYKMESQFELVAGSLTEGVQYDFVVEASKTGKTTSAAVQRVVVVNRTIPTTTVVCYSCHLMASYLISASFHVGLHGSCDTCSENDVIDYLWEVKRVEHDGTLSDFPINSETTTTGATSSYLVVKEGALANSHAYEFKLRILVDGAEGYSKLVLQPNMPPVNGACELTYDDAEDDQIYVLDTVVSFSCANWKDDAAETDTPLVYTIIACRRAFGDTEDLDDAFILYRGTREISEAYIPLGYEEYDYWVNIKILVEDQLGTTTLALDNNVTVVIQQHLDGSTVDWLQEKVENDLNRLVRLNDPQNILDFSAAAITALNSISYGNGIGVGHPDYIQSVAVRELVTQRVAEISATTLKEVQQVASVLEQCVKVPAQMQNPAIHQYVMTSVDNMVSSLQELVNREGQSSFQRATNDVLDIVGGLIRIVNYAVYDREAATAVSTNASVNFDETYRRQMISELTADINMLITNVLRSKVVDEEALTFLSPVVSLTTIKTTPSTAPKEQVNGGVHWTLPDHVFASLNASVEIFTITMVYEQNPFTYGFPPHSLASNGYSNITSRVPSIEFTYPDGTLIPIANLASPGDGNDRRVRLAMSQSAWQYLSAEDTRHTVNSSGSLYQPRAELAFETTPDPVEPLQSVAITITNNNRDSNTAVHIMITYTKVYNNNRAESNPAIEAYLDSSPNPNKVNNSASLRITDGEMADGADHQLYTFFLDPALNDTTRPEIYLNISNYFTYEILDVQIAVYYSLCLYYENSSGVWATDGLYVSPESIYTVTVCYSDHLTSFGSFVINPPNLVNVTNIVNIDFSQNPIALITVVVIMFLYIVGMIWARSLDLRDIKRASVIPLCGPNGSFKYEITIKTAAGIGSGTTANVGICVYGYDARSGSRHLSRKDAFQRGAVDTMQIASDVCLGEIYKIKLWHDNTGLDPGWCIDRVMVKNVQTGSKYYFLVNSWLQVYPDDEDETCLEKAIRVATEEELMNFSNIFGSQLSYGWEDAHLWLSVIERPTRSRFTRVQRVTCCVTLLLTFMLFSAMWYQGYDPNGDVIPEDTVVGILRWKDIAVGAIVSLMVFPASIIIVCMFKKSKSKVAPVRPWLERSRTAQTIEILDEILDSGGRRYPGDISDSDDDGESRQHRGFLPGQIEFLAQYANENAEAASLFHSRAQTPISNKSKMFETSDQRSKLHKGSGTVKSPDIKRKIGSKIWSDDSAIQLSDSPSTSGVTGSTDDICISSEDRSSTSGSPDWPNRTNATKKGTLHFQNEASQKPEKFSSTSFMESAKSEKKKTLHRRNTAYVRNTDSASPPNFIPDDDDTDDLWDLSDNDEDKPGENLVITNKQAVLRRTRGTKFENDEDIAFPVGHRRGLVLDDVILSHSDDSDSDVPLHDFLTSRGESRISRASTHLGTSPQPSSERFLLPHWCIYLNYFLCFVTMAICIFFIILYGNDFGADTTKRWLLTMFIALLESVFLIEPIKVVLFAVFLALISKPINPDENDNLVDEPLVETYRHTDSFSKVRAPGGFALDKCKREAQKTKRSNKLVLNLAIYLIFLSSVAAVASWDKDTMGYYNTLAIKKSFLRTEFTLPTDAEGPRWQNNSATFKEIRTVSDIWAWMDQVFAVKMYDDKSTLDSENINNNLLGKIRLRQQRGVPGECILDANGKFYNQLTHAGQSCLNNDAGIQQTASFGPGWITGNDSDGSSWSFTDAEFGGVMYWGEDLMYDDSGYSQFLEATSDVASIQENLTSLQTLNWIDRNTRVVFVEFTQLNQATYWFTVSVVMFEIGVTGGVRPSYHIQTVRIVVPSTSFYVDMLFMAFVAVVGLLLLLRELKKARDPKMSAQIYFSKWTNWVNMIVLALTIMLCVLYVYKEVYMEEVVQKYISDKEAFTNFYKIAFYTNLVTISACSLLFAVILRATRLFRFVKSWSAFGETIASSARLLLGAGIMLMIFILGFATLGFLVYGQSYTQVIPDFRDFPNAIYAMFRAFGGRLDFRICLDYSPVFTIFYFFSFYFGIFYVFCRLFAAILINEYKFTRGRKSHLRTDVPDYEILRHLIARIKMRLGIIKPRQYRPMVRFEGMSTPSSRGSFMSLDSFDTLSFIPGRISQCSYATGISSSSSDSGFGTPSDHSISVYDYLTLDQPSDTPMETRHLDYLYDRLSNYCVDMMLHRFERVSVLTDEVAEMESNAVKISILTQQRAMLQSQSKEIAVAASTMTIQPNYIPPQSESRHSEGSATAYSSRGHFSQQTVSQTSLSSGRRSAISSDSLFHTVMHSMFPLRQSWVSDSQAELDSMRKLPVTHPHRPQKTQPAKSMLRGTSSANAVLRREGSNLSSTKSTTSSGVAKRRPHSDEGARSKSGRFVAQDQEAQNDLNTRTRRTIISAFRATPTPENRPRS